MFFFGSVWLTLLLCCFLIGVNAQASQKNPFIWQVLAQYNVAQSNTTKSYLVNSSAKVYSQDFQTVFANKDVFGYNQRFAMDLGDACNETTIDDVQRLNGNLATSPSMMSQPSIGLVRRGGRCLKWSDKIANVQSLSSSYQLQITGMIIYDNILYNETTFIQESTDDMSYPTWPTQTLPTYRNISYMTDENIIDARSTFLAVYFAPLSYISYLNQTLLQKSSVSNTGSIQAYTQLTMTLKETHFTTTSNSGVFGSPQSPQSPDTPTNPASAADEMTLENSKRNIIIYAVTAVVVVVLTYLVLRWCMGIRRHASEDVERSARQGENMLLTNMRSTKVIPFLELGNICPIHKYNKATMTNITCAICLEDFKDDLFVRVLPCRHGYCTACIDVWLTKKSSLCPICKFDCRTLLNLDDDQEGENSRDEGIVVEGANMGGVAGRSASEVTPANVSEEEVRTETTIPEANPVVNHSEEVAASNALVDNTAATPTPASLAPEEEEVIVNTSEGQGVAQTAHRPNETNLPTIAPQSMQS